MKLNSVASFVIVIAGLKAASGFIEPFLLAILLSLIVAPVMSWLRRFKVAQGFGLAIVFILLTLVLVGAGVLLAASIRIFIGNLPFYQERVLDILGQFAVIAQGWGYEFDIEQLQGEVGSGEVMRSMVGTLTGIGELITHSVVVILIALFILGEATGMPAKIRMAFGERESALSTFERFNSDLMRYLGIKTVVSIATGLAAYLLLFLVGVNNALMWAVLAFLLNYVPNIGSIIAAIPAVAIALLQLGFWQAGIVALGYVAINTLFGSIIEPRVMGRGLGLSALVVFSSLLFWGWVLGPVGMLLSVPLTIIAKLACENSADWKWVAILLADSKDLEREQALRRASDVY